MKLADRLGMVLAEMAQEDSRVFVLDGDLADSDGAEAFALQHPCKFLMAGIAEQNMVSVAAGMASCGKRPFVFSFSAFLAFRAYDQIRVGLCQAKQPVTLVGSHAGGLSARNGKTHAALNDVALMLSLPGIDVWAPADFQDVQLCLRHILEGNAPAYVRLPRTDFGPDCIIPSAAADADADADAVNRWLRPSVGVNIVSTGLATHWARDAVEGSRPLLAKVGLLHCPRLRFEDETLEKLRQSEKIFVVEDHYEIGGLGTLLKSLLPKVSVETIAWPQTFLGEQGDPMQLRTEHGLDSISISSRIRAGLTIIRDGDC